MASKWFFIYILVALLGAQWLWVINPCAAGGTALKIIRLQIYFDNQRAEIVVPQNQTSLMAHVELEFEGAGFLKGFWEVDGQVFAHVQRHLDNGKGGTVIFASPKVPALPTWRTGSHLLRFRLTDPDLNQAEPEAFYFVTARQPLAEEINLISPADKSTLHLAPYPFSWVSGQDNAGYLLVFFDAQENTIFSAYTKEEHYTLPSSALGEVFSTGEHYQWQVDGYDENLNKTASSTRQSFFLR